MKNHNLNCVSRHSHAYGGTNADNPNLSILKPLIRWFRKNKRDLPWRRNRSAYSVWISEIMLQQTTVKAVIPFYEKWMKRYPDVKSVAKAREQEILRLWEGLGYYTRAKNILKASRIIASQFQGRFPDDYKDAIKLPGIGPYTAGAILSIAFGKSFPILDANIKRVGQRILGEKSWNHKTEERIMTWLREAMAIVPPDEFNEGLMELGQTICTAISPICPICPIQSHCEAFSEGIQDLIPTKKRNKPVLKKTWVLLILCKDKILIRKRKQGVLKDLWSFPAYHRREDIPEFLKRSFGKKFHQAGDLSTRIHHYTRYRDHLCPLVFRIDSIPSKKMKDSRWIPLSDAEQYPFPSIYRKILREMDEKYEAEFKNPPKSDH